MKLKLFYFVLLLLIFGFRHSTAYSQTVRLARGTWSANGKKVSAGEAVSPGTKINNNNREIPNNDIISISDGACSRPLTVDCTKSDCNETFYVPKSYKNSLFPCFLIRIFATDARGGDILGINGIVEIKNGSIDLTEKVKLFEEESGIIFFSPLPDVLDDIPRVKFEKSKTTKIEKIKPGLYKLIYKSDEYHILALESNQFRRERKKIEKFVKSVEDWKQRVDDSEREKLENSVMISMIWQRLDEIAGKDSAPNEKKRKKEKK